MNEQKQATPDEELRQQFMDHSTPMTETGHWARRHIEQLELELAQVKEDYGQACLLVAKMHCAAVGEVTAPKRGVIEDVEDLRLERDALQADNARLRAALEKIVIEWHDYTPGTHFARLKAALDKEHRP